MSIVLFSLFSLFVGVLQVDQLPDRVIAHLYPFVSLLDEELQTFFKSNRQLTDEETEMVRYGRQTTTSCLVPLSGIVAN